jgi:sugar phosphate isomerase/epimerase
MRDSGNEKDLEPVGFPVIGGRAHNLEQAQRVCDMGLPYAEISLYDPDIVERQKEAWQTLREEYGIEYIAHYPNEDRPLDLVFLKERFVPRIRNLLHLSRQLCISKATLHFWVDRRWIPASFLAEKLELLAEIVKMAKDHGIVLCLENLTEKCESLGPVFEMIPDLKMTLDIGHAELLSSENNSFELIWEFFPRIFNVHAHDNNGGKWVEDDLHLALGKGTVDYTRIFSMLKDRGYEHSITMEMSPEDMHKTKKILDASFLGKEKA